MPYWIRVKFGCHPLSACRSCDRIYQPKWYAKCHIKWLHDEHLLFQINLTFVTPALAKCDIGVRFSIWPSVCPSVFPSTIYVYPSIMTYSLKPLYLWISNFICSMIRVQDLWIVKFSLVENLRWLPILKIAKLIKLAFSPEQLGINS